MKGIGVNCRIGGNQVASIKITLALVKRPGEMFIIGTLRENIQTHSEVYKR